MTTDYGFRSFTADGRIQFDSTKGNYSGLVVVQQGSQTSGSLVLTVDPDDFVFARVSPTSGNNILLFSVQEGLDVWQSGQSQITLGTEPPNHMIHYVVARTSEELSTQTSSDEYGMRILSSNLDGSGNVVQYDTSNLSGNGAFNLTEYFPRKSVGGGGFGTTNIINSYTQGSEGDYTYIPPYREDMMFEAPNFNASILTSGLSSMTSLYGNMRNTNWPTAENAGVGLEILSAYTYWYTTAFTGITYGQLMQLPLPADENGDGVPDFPNPGPSPYAYAPGYFKNLDPILLGVVP